MISYEGTSDPTTYMPTELSSSEAEEPSMTMYGRNISTDTRVPAQKVPFEDLRVRFELPWWINYNRPMRGNSLPALET